MELTRWVAAAQAGKRSGFDCWRNEEAGLAGDPPAAARSRQLWFIGRQEGR